MKVRLLASVCCLAAISTLLEGCAGGATRPEPPSAPVAAAQMDISNLPQMMLSGGSPAEVKALAMGAARSKGWIMSESTPDRLVVQRPLDASTLAGLPSTVPVSPGTLMEVTSFFIDQSGGVNVATKAELVSQTPGQPSPTRIDYTDNFREPLTQSLVSLRDAWSRHRGRLARAAPPEGGWKDQWSDDLGMASAAVNTDNQMTMEIDPVGDEAPAQLAQTPSAPLPVYTPQPVQPAPEPTRPVPEPRRPQSGGAPVVDAGSSSNRPAQPRTASQTNLVALPAVRTPAAKPSAPSASAVKVSTTKPPSAPATVAKTPATKTAATAAAKTPTAKPSAPAAKTQTAKTPAAKASPAPATAAKTQTAKTPATKAPATKTATDKPATKKANWSTAAEKYARQKGCKVAGKGTQLIESRKDGEVHKISCTGADSVLVKCQNGTCKGLL